MIKEIDWKQVYERWYSLSKDEQKGISDSLVNLTQEQRKELFEREPFARKVYVEKLQCFDDEDHLLLLLYIRELGEKYPKVTTIAKTKLTPDIDLLRIESSYGKEPFIIGYETKVLGGKRIFDAFYKGLGETLCYFNYGINQAWLVVGIPVDAPADVENKLKETWEFLKKSRIIPTYVGLRLQREKRSSSVDINPEGSFYASSYEDAKFFRECLLKKQFAYSKKWVRVFTSD